MTRISENLVIVTGASRGIGAATAQAFARRGARVALLARSPSSLSDVAEKIRSAGGEAECFPVDVGDWQAVSRVSEDVISSQGVPDIVVNNAGAGRFLFLEETTAAEAGEMMAAPYFGAFHEHPVLRASPPHVGVKRIPIDLAKLRKGILRILPAGIPRCGNNAPVRRCKVPLAGNWSFFRFVFRH